ncbi:MAG: class I SAM-dependent methyltransferase [Patescibacteria group bacterium]
MQTKDVLNKVRHDYGLIAEEFSKTRLHPWPEFAEFLKNLNLGGNAGKIKLLDIGCGNGRLYDFLKNEPIIYTGIDNNKNLLTLAKKQHKKAKFKYASATKLPFSANSFDTVWCIAVLHHLPTKGLRLKACREMKRVLKKNGKLMITVWNLWQKKYRKFINKKTHDALIPWNNKLNRYYYAFKPAELKSLIQKSGFPIIKKVKSDHNIAFVCYEKN